MNKKYVLVGAGPANIHCALELLKLGVPGSNIIIFERGKPVNKRHCPPIVLTGEAPSCQLLHYL